MVMMDISNRLLRLVHEMTYLSLVAQIWKQLDEFSNLDSILSREMFSEITELLVFSRDNSAYQSQNFFQLELRNTILLSNDKNFKK